MRIVILVSTNGSALALKLAKSGDEAMMAVDPKGRRTGVAGAVGWIVEGSEIPRPLENLRIDSVLRSSPPVSATAAIRQLARMSGPRRWFCSFLTHRQKRKPKIRKGPSEK